MKKILSLCSLFLLLTSCSVSIQKEGTNIKSIIFDNVPTTAIKVGHFDEANINLKVTYSDNKTQLFHIVEDWLPEEYQHYLGEAGSYTVNIIFRGNTIPLNFTMEANDAAPQYQVTFYNYRGNVLESYSISHRLDAVYHGVVEEREGFVFTGWDKSLYGVHKDMSYYPVYEIDPSFVEGK